MIPDADIEAVRALVASGLTDAQLGARYGVGSERARGYRKRHGIASTIRRPPPNPSRETRSIPASEVEAVNAMINDGPSDQRIAKDYGCGRATVGLFRRRHRIPARIVLAAPPEVKGNQVRFERPKQIGGYRDDATNHWVRVFEPMPAIGDLRPENEDEERREFEQAVRAGDGRPPQGGERPNDHPGWPKT